MGLPSVRLSRQECVQVPLMTLRMTEKVQLRSGTRLPNLTEVRTAVCLLLVPKCVQCATHVSLEPVSAVSSLCGMERVRVCVLCEALSARLPLFRPLSSGLSPPPRNRTSLRQTELPGWGKIIAHNFG